MDHRHVDGEATAPSIRPTRPRGGTPIQPPHPEVPAMTVIHRASPWDAVFTLRGPRISAAPAERRPEPDLVGAGSRR
jgi:hypothetical protein